MYRTKLINISISKLENRNIEQINYININIISYDESKIISRNIIEKCNLSYYISTIKKFNESSAQKMMKNNLLLNINGARM